MDTTNYIFTDIDGVLNTRNHLVRQKKKSGECSRFNWCPIACNNLLRLCKKYNYKIVISSSWRHEFTIEKLKEYFKSNGISEEYIIGTTPSVAEQGDSQNYCRGHEVKNWIEQNAQNAPYLIIDDDATMLESQDKHLIRVSPEDGFASPSAYTLAIQITNETNST